MRYLITGLSASRVNLIQNDYAAGLPSPTAFLGLSTVISMRLGMERHRARIMPILHSVTPSIGRTRPEFDLRGKSFSPMEIPEDMHGHVEFSMLLELPGTTTKHEVSKAMRGTSLAGGVIFAKNHGKAFEVKEVIGSGESLLRAPRGRAMIPGLLPDLRHKVSFADKGQMEMIRDLLSVRATQENPNPGFRVPVAVGFRLLTLPGEGKIPACARDNETPHVFAEPGVGVGELISIRNHRLTDLDAENIGQMMWSWSVKGRHFMAHSVYNPEIF